MPEEKRTDDVEELLSEEKSLSSRKQTLIDDLLKQREAALKHQEAAITAFDDKLAKLGYHANSNVDPGDDPRRVNDRAVDTDPRIGAVMPDHTIYAGISPDTGKAMYAAPADASLTMTFNGAKEYAQDLNTQKAHGHDDWHVPTKNELNVLFNNRAAIGGFNVTGSRPAGWYWSATPGLKWYTSGQRFSDGRQYHYGKDSHSSVRLVR
jgi:Protein of unknown function (DUF1566)